MSIPTPENATPLSQLSSVRLLPLQGSTLLSKAAGETADLTSVNTIQTLGYYTPGDGGSAMYKRVATQPAHGGKFRCLDRFLPDGSVSASNGGWFEIVESKPNVKQFGAKGDSATTDTTSIQAAFDYALTLLGGDYSEAAGYLAYFFPTVIFPAGTYVCGTVTVPPRIRIEGQGRAVIRSATGTTTTPATYFVNNVVTNFFCEGLTLQFFATAFRVPTDNIDFSRISFEKCVFIKNGLCIDTVSYTSSRSTNLTINRCEFGYNSIGFKIYTDSFGFTNNFIEHTSNNYFGYIDSKMKSTGNIYVPVGAGTSKCWFYYTASDSVRQLLFDNDRFGGEAGSCPIVVVGNVNQDNLAEYYKNIGITFVSCFMATGLYNPDSLGAITACVVLKQTTAKINTINYVSFRDCNLLSDLSGGVVQTYGVSDVDSMLPDGFVIDYDYSSAVAANHGINKPTSANLAKYVNSPQLTPKLKNVALGSGELTVAATATAGKKKATFKFDRTYPDSYYTPNAFLLTLTGQGDAAGDSFAYCYSSVYILQITGEVTSGAQATISFTKLHGAAGGNGGDANANIVSAHWGTGDTGSASLATSGSTKVFDITIAFGTNIVNGKAFLKPLC